jgi:tRNA isopentenyl-2-thiomethyl-A-37 hydroxylase MiaE
MRRKAITAEAQRLIDDFGPEAYQKAVAAERLARRKQDKRLAKFLGEVVRQIARDAARAQQHQDGSQI